MIKQKDFKANMHRRFLAIGRLLLRVNTQKTYKSLRYRTFELWINSRHNHYGGRRTVYNYIRLYLLWERKLKGYFTLKEIQSIDYSKLLKVAYNIERTDNEAEIRHSISKARKDTLSTLRYGEGMKYKFTGRGVIANCPAGNTKAFRRWRDLQSDSNKIKLKRVRTYRKDRISIQTDQFKLIRVKPTRGSISAQNLWCTYGGRNLICNLIPFEFVKKSSKYDVHVEITLVPLD